jgi:hypothetical protein
MSHREREGTDTHMGESVSYIHRLKMGHWYEVHITNSKDQEKSNNVK